jgi:hypothetical protein
MWSSDITLAEEASWSEEGAFAAIMAYLAVQGARYDFDGFTGHSTQSGGDHGRSATGRSERGPAHRDPQQRAVSTVVFYCGPPSKPGGLIANICPASSAFMVKCLATVDTVIEER